MKEVDTMTKPSDTSVTRRSLITGAGLGVLSLAVGTSYASALSAGKNVDLAPIELVDAVNSALQYLNIRSTGRSNFTQVGKYIDSGATKLIEWERQRLDDFKRRISLEREF